MKKALLLLPLLVVSCNNQKSKSLTISDYKKAAELVVLTSASIEYKDFEFYTIKTDYLSYKSEIASYIFKSEYYCYDELYNYYEHDYLVAINNNVCQIKEIQK